MMTKIAMLAATLAVGAAVGASAASADTINQREHRQVKRIFNGVRNSDVSLREFRQLGRGQAHIREMERRARASGGFINGTERDRIRDALDRQSDRIWDKKHNN
jgi:hypothetical protein